MSTEAHYRRRQEESSGAKFDEYESIIHNLKLEKSDYKAKYEAQRELTVVGITQQVKLLKRIEEIDIEAIRLRRIEAAAVLAVDSEEWAGDAFYERMGLLMDALRGE